METIYEKIRQFEKNDQSQDTVISKYVSFNLREYLEKIDAYINSKHISGDKDSAGRDKPFFNIVTAAVNIWYRATDIDRKDIAIRASKTTDESLSFFATVLLQEWMRKTNFGRFLNEWGRTLAKYGSAVTKHIEKYGELYSQVIPWNRLMCDAVDFDNNIVIEKLWMTPAQLRKNKVYNKEMVEKLCENTVTRQTMDYQDKDVKNDYILIYEVHGEVPLSYKTGREEDEDVYKQQMFVFSMQAKKDKSNQYDEYMLYSGSEKKNPYMITHLIKEDGRTLGIGAVENLFEAQWMVNHSQKQIKDQLDLASKLLFQTSDGNFVGQNALTSIETGDILIHQMNQPLTQLNNKADIGAVQSFQQGWQQAGMEINGISESMMGSNPPSHTAWRQTQAILQESHSLFEIMTENKDMYLQDMLREYILPNLKKKMDTTEEISSIMQDHQIKFLEKKFVPKEVIKRYNRKLINKVLAGTFEPGMEMDLENEATQEVQGEQVGNMRFFKPSETDNVTWAKALKDLEWELEIDITGENYDKANIMQTLTMVFQLLSSGQPLTDDAKLVLNKILSLSGGMSPIELSNQPQPQQQPMNPNQTTLPSQTKQPTMAMTQ
jgi:hypothetical protein